jgi:hypothetical protein
METQPVVLRSGLTATRLQPADPLNQAGIHLRGLDGPQSWKSKATIEEFSRFPRDKPPHPAMAATPDPSRCRCRRAAGRRRRGRG